MRVFQIFKGRPKYPYGEYWAFQNDDEAMKMIIEPHVSWEEFEEGGRVGASKIRQIEPDKNSVLLDFGCGIGRILKYLIDYKQLYGVDVSKTMLAMTRQRIPAENLSLLHTFGCQVPVGKESVDLVYSLLTLQHIDRADVVRIAKEFYRILRAGGHCYLQFPCYGDGEVGRDTRLWTVEGIRNLLRDFREISLEKRSEPPWENLYVVVQK